MPDDSAFVYFSLANNSAIAGLQRQVMDAVGAADYQAPETFHITAIYCNSISDHDLREIIEAAANTDWPDAGFDRFTVAASKLGVFENGDERALHIVVEPSPALLAVQTSLHRQFVDAGFADQLSPYSSPAQYKPHITLAYLPADAPVPDLQFDLEIEVSELVFGRDEYRAVGTIMAKDFAMQTSEKNKWVYRPSQADANYTPLSPNPDQLCDGCRWFVSQGDGGPMCHLIDNYPSDIVATGRCDRWEARPEPEINPLPVVIVDNVEMDELERALENPAVQKPLLQAILDAKQSPEPPVESAKSHDHAEPVDIYIAPASNKRGLFSKALDLFRRDTLKPGVSILKSAGQPRMMFIVTSSSYQDRHTQWIETRTLEKDVARMWTKDDDVFMGGVQHLFWHWKELGPVGEIVYSDVWGPFQVDVSREILGDPVSFAFYNYVENHPEIEWGASQNFIAYKSEDRPNGTFTHIWRRETTTLPREDAAHLLTFTGVVPMPTKRQEYLNKMMKEAYGIDNASELLEKGLDALKAELEAKGVVHKAAVPAGAEATTEAAADLFAPMMLKMVEDVADVLERVDKLETGTTGLAEKQKAFEEGAVAALQKSVDELTNTVKGISDELKLAPRSVQQQQGGSSNLPDDETITFEQLKQKAPGGNGKRDDFFGDMDVPAQS